LEREKRDSEEKERADRAAKESTERDAREEADREQREAADQRERERIEREDRERKELDEREARERKDREDGEKRDREKRERIERKEKEERDRTEAANKSKEDERKEREVITFETFSRRATLELNLDRITLRHSHSRTLLPHNYLSKPLLRAQCCQHRGLTCPNRRCEIRSFQQSQLEFRQIILLLSCVTYYPRRGKLVKRRIA